jgi:hypothetical protein
MKVSEIPSGELVTMTPELYQEFAQGGCVPACHLTHDWINIGDNFKLATVPHWTMTGSNYGHEKEIDVMLAEKSSVDDYNAKMKAEIERARKYKEEATKGRTGCFRVNGEIVP